MTDAEFEQLKEDIKETYAELERLQKLYMKEVGKRWVPKI
jgi:hypothetical protein